MAGQDTHSPGYGKQEILNALELPPRPLRVDAQSPIPVRVRVLWERDGVELIEALAIGRTRTLVWVQLRDPGSQFVARWLPAADFERSLTTPGSH